MTDPIRVDFVAKHFGGRLGMTFAPGKKSPGRDGPWDRELGIDLYRLRNEYGTGVLVSLIEDHELDSLGIQSLPSAAEEFGIELERFAIPDGGVPTDAVQFAQLARRTVSRLLAGRRVVIHCRGGLGRTGMLAAACLRLVGLDAERAIDRVRAARAGTIETAEQEEFVRRVELREART